MTDANDMSRISRRTFLKTGATTAAAASLALPAFGDGDGAPSKPPAPLPTRVLGRTGQRVSILSLGTGRPLQPRMLNAAYDAGIRYLDTADCYGNGESEKVIAEWLAANGRRKDFILVTKDHPNTPDEWVTMLDRRLDALKTDYIDLFFIHGLGGGSRGSGDEMQRDIPKMKEWKTAAEKMKKSGKVRFVGFSTHAEMDLRIALLNRAAVGGWVDAIMVATDPKLARDNAEFNQALDACHDAGIGLISMKEMRGLAGIAKVMPGFKERGLTTHQAILHTVWSDERFASICSDMPNLPILMENATAARNFKPVDAEGADAVLKLYERHARTFCNGCDGSCQRAGRTKASLCDITKALSYHDEDGLYDEARRLFASLTPEQRDWHGADLAAASAACVSNLDFATLLKRAEEKLA
ncbi:MAG: aldo/keto reductase [Phycisphaerae bacterium]|jgi:predicted aldo/keto reductase-like oxidoreductase